MEAVERVARAALREQEVVAAVHVLQIRQVSVLSLSTKKLHQNLSAERKSECRYGTDLADLRRGDVLAHGVDPDVAEPVLGPAQRGAVQLCEPPALELVADDGDPGRVPAGVLVEAGDAEEQVLERVERVVFCRHAVEGLLVRLGKETARLREAQVGLGFGGGGGLLCLAAGRGFR